MALNFKQFFEGIRVKAKAILTSDTKGELEVLSSDGKLYYYDGTVRSPLVTEAGTVVITNKDLVDSTTNIVDVSDPTKRINFDAAGTTGTRTTLLSSQTANRTITIPDIAGTLITSADTGTVTSTMILDGTVVNADINASAAIVDTKLATIATSGKVSNSATTATSSNTINTILLRDGSGQVAATTFTGALVGNADTATLASTVTTNANLTGPVTSVGNATSIGTGVITSTMILDSTILDADINASAAITRSKLASGTNNALVNNSSSGVLSESTDITLGTNNFTLANTKHIELQASTDSTTTGSNASLAAFTAGGVRVTNVSLASLANIPAGANGQQFVLFNRTGAIVTIKDSSGAIGTAANRILTGTSADINMAVDSALVLSYDSTTARWQIVGGSGGGSVNLTGAVTSVGSVTSLGSFTSANLSGALTDETGSGLAVFNTSPTLVTPALGTPSALVGTNITGTATAFTASNVTTNANLTGDVTSVGNATTYSGTVPLNKGGTGQTTKAPAFDALQPMTTGGDLIYGAASGTGTRLANGTQGQILTSGGSTNAPLWLTPSFPAPNYILNPNAEIDTTGWATYADAAGVSPVDGTGGSPVVTFTRTTSSPLRGAGSFLVTKDAANRQGNGASYALTIDSADQGKVLQCSFDYQIASGTYADNDISCWIYDVTNAVVIQPAPYLLKNTTIIDKMAFEFQASGNSTSYRLIFHVASTSASAYTVKLDNVQLGPNSKLFSNAETLFSAAISSTGVVSNLSKSSWINGNAVVSATSTYTITFQTGQFTVAPNIVYGSATNGSNVIFLTVSVSATTLVVILHDQGGGNTAQPFYVYAHKQGVDYTNATAGKVSSTEADTRVIAAQISGIPANTSANAPIIFPTILRDTHGAYNTVTGIYTVPVSGFYKGTIWIDGSMGVGNNIYISLNGSTTNGGTSPNITTSLVVNQAKFGTGIVYANAGQTLDFKGTGTNTSANASSASWERLTGPAQVQASESINARYFASATSISGSLATINFTTKDFDSHNAYSAGTYTVPSAGKYQINSALLITGTIALNSTFIMEIQKNGTVVSRTTEYLPATLTDAKIMIDDLISCIAGDTLRIQVSTSVTGPTIVSSNFDNFVSLFRAGN